jgi:uncharacterized protein YkwD
VSALLGAFCAVTIGVSLNFAFGAGLATADAACANAKAHPHEATRSELRRAMTCLINRERAKRDRHELKPNRRLKKAAEAHNDVMLEHDCFRHDCPGEPGLNHRVRRAGYTKGQEAWRVAEDLGFDNTPRQMLRRLMHSRFNRRNLLRRSFRDIGVGVGWGTPVEGLDDSRFATYTIVFGWRRARD